MTMAMCRGMALTVSLNGQDLFLFGRADLVGHEDVAVGQLLQLRLEALHVVCRHARALLFRAHLLVRVAAQRTDLDAALFDLLVQHLHQILAALLGERRDVEADDRPVGVRREAEVRRLDRLLDGFDDAAVVGLDQDLPRLGRVDLRELDQRCRHAVRLDLELLHERRRRAAGPHGGDVVLERLDRLLEARLGLREEIFEWHQLWTSVPTCSPFAARTIASFWEMSKMISGMSRSSASAAAVASITPRRLSSRSRCVSSSIFFASFVVRGSASYTPSTWFLPMRMTSAPISAARSVAAVSLVKYGLPVPAAKMTTRPFSRWRIALRRMYGSATSWMVIADCTRVATSICSRADWSASALMTIASIPM